MNRAVFDKFTLAGRLVVVTGASSGLGDHLARVMAAAGARVVVAARRLEKLHSLVTEITGAGGEARAVALDVTDATAVAACFDDILDWGAPDVLINNAGVTITKGVQQQTTEDFDHVLDTNLRGSWLVATEAARRMIKAEKGGSIINIASILGERVAGGVAPYAISKAGVIQMTKALALELARHGIRCYALLPGYIVTDLNREFLEGEQGMKLRARIPSRRFGDMSDLDGPVLLLASEAGAAMSGAVMAVDGAHLVSSL